MVAAKRRIPTDRVGQLQSRIEVIEGIIGSGVSIVVDQVLLGSIDGMNKAFITQSNFVPNSTQIFMNGLGQRKGTGNDYVESGSNIILFNQAPLPGDTLRANYTVQL
jgi:hypothetical protein